MHAIDFYVLASIQCFSV